jgi:hypothetical protein
MAADQRPKLPVRHILMDSNIHLIPARRFTGRVAATRMRLGAPGAMLRRLAGKIFGVNGPQCDAGCTALLTQAAFAQNAHVVVESSFAYAIEANSPRRLNGTNLFDRM